MDKTESPQLESLLKQILAQLQGTRGVDQLAKGYVAAWAEIDHAVKNSNNPHLGNDYADLTAILDTMRGPFSKNGLALLQCPGVLSADGSRITVVGVLFHSSGQMMQFTSELPLLGTLKKDGTVLPATAQNAGSTITYCKRYQAQSIAGIASKDDDGNAASGVTAPRGSTPAVGPETEDKVAKWRIDLAATTLDDIEGDIRTRLENLNDVTLVAEFAAHRTALKKAAKAAKEKKAAA